MISGTEGDPTFWIVFAYMFGFITFALLLPVMDWVREKQEKKREFEEKVDLWYRHHGAAFEEEECCAEECCKQTKEEGMKILAELMKEGKI